MENHFRQFIKWKARKLGIKGWVKNLPAGKAGLSDQRVEAVFKGSKENIDAMILFCKKGPFLAKIKGVTVVWEEEDSTILDFEVIT